VAACARQLLLALENGIGRRSSIIVPEVHQFSLEVTPAMFEMLSVKFSHPFINRKAHALRTLSQTVKN
jgi:hypothetical protein